MVRRKHARRETIARDSGDADYGDDANEVEDDDDLEPGRHGSLLNKIAETPTHVRQRTGVGCSAAIRRRREERASAPQAKRRGSVEYR
jgi:hypothetical protein